MSAHNRIEIMHGVNLDQLGRRPTEHYGSLTLDQLERQIEAWAKELSLSVRFFRTNHEGAFVEHLHDLDSVADAAVINPGAWTHYSWAIRDAVESAGVPVAEVHLSDVGSREPFRRISVLEGLPEVTVSGKGPEGYRDALEALAARLA